MDFCFRRNDAWLDDSVIPANAGIQAGGNLSNKEVRCPGLQNFSLLQYVLRQTWKYQKSWKIAQYRDNTLKKNQYTVVLKKKKTERNAFKTNGIWIFIDKDWYKTYTMYFVNWGFISKKRISINNNYFYKATSFLNR